MKKRIISVALTLSIMLLCVIGVYAYQVDKYNGTVGSYSCYGTLWTISSTSMGATTSVDSSASVSSNTTSITVRSGGFDPVKETNGPYASNEVDVTASIGGTIYSATGTHSITLKTGDSWSGDTFY